MGIEFTEGVKCLKKGQKIKVNIYIHEEDNTWDFHKLTKEDQFEMGKRLNDQAARTVVLRFDERNPF